MCDIELSKIATVLRPLSSDIIYGREKLCLSASYLRILNNAFDEVGFNSQGITSSFHLVQTNSSKSNTIRDIQFLEDLVQKTVALKIIPDHSDCQSFIDLSKFKNIRTLEIHKINIKHVLGIQKIRSQLQHVLCCHSLENVTDILDKCGGDNTQRYIWSELKKGTFAYNSIQTFDGSFECTPWLHTLDLSHNNLTDVSHITNLPNLKYLNMSYNKLEQVPKFESQLCTRLQILILSSNFIEDVIGLTTLINLVQLDLSHNCLTNHKALSNISHLTSLQCLSLQGNPIYFHPQHRKQTCNYLNKNTTTLKFVLDNIPLDLEESSSIGFFYPILPNILLQTTNSEESIAIASQEKTRKIRNVNIEEDFVAEEKRTLTSPSMSVSSQHLEIKKQVEQLRREYGDSWLYRDAGRAVQDVLGFQKSFILSSTPADSDLDSLCVPGQISTSDKIYETEPYITTASQSYFTAENLTDSNKPEEISDISDGEDMCSGDEGIYLATTDKKEQVFVVITDSHISERDVTTSKEKARWHVNTIVSCHIIIRDNTTMIQLDFDTVRRDRKQRIYDLDNAENFHSSIQGKIANRPEENKTTYQCMKCSEYFFKNENDFSEGTSLTCPKCKSNHIIKSM